MTFYGSDLGNRLINESLFSRDVVDFIDEEKKLIHSFMNGFDVLIEIGCMNGRYLEYALKHGYKYVGLDIIPSYIEEGRIRVNMIPLNKRYNYNFILGDASNLDLLLKRTSLKLDLSHSLLFFPFNSFGNMDDYLSVIKALKRYLYFINGFNGNPYNEDQIMTGEDLENLPMIIMPEGCYCRPESKGSGKIMSGWLQYTTPIDPDFENQGEIEPGFGKNNLNDYGWAVRKTLTSYIPDIERMGSINSVVSGLYEDTPDHNPLIGYDPIVPNLIHCAGFSGHGLMHAPFSAQIVSHLVSAGKNLEEISLPFNVGLVDVKTFWVDRVFKNPEGMVI